MLSECVGIRNFDFEMISAYISALIGNQPNIQVGALKNDMAQRFGMELSYKRVWKAKQKLLIRVLVIGKKISMSYIHFSMQQLTSTMDLVRMSNMTKSLKITVSSQMLGFFGGCFARTGPALRLSNFVDLSFA